MPKEAGAAPAVEMAIVNSEVHRLRDTLAEERSQWAQLRLEIRDRMDRMERSQAADALMVGRLADTVVRTNADVERALTLLEGSPSSDSGGICGELHRARGGVRIVQWILGCGLLIEIGRTLLEHVKP